MKGQLEQDLVLALMPLLPPEKLDEAKLKIVLALSKYDVTEAETAIIPYEGEINDVILKRFLAAKLARGLSRRTVEFYSQTIKFFFDQVSKPYMDVTPDDVRLYLASRIYKDGVSKVSANNERRNLSSFYTWLQKEEILLRNPMSKVEQLKETKVKKKAYQPLELEKIRYACRSNREKALVEILSSTWCRVSELCEIKITDIEQDRVMIHGKGDKYRTVYLNAKAQIALQAYLMERNDDNPFLFAKSVSLFSQRQKGIKTSDLLMWYTRPEYVHKTDAIEHSSVEHLVRNIGIRAGVSNVHPHRFRRTGATMALRQGMPITSVSKLLGHESIETTQIYLDISDEELEQTHKHYVV